MRAGQKKLNESQKKKMDRRLHVFSANWPLIPNLPRGSFGTSWSLLSSGGARDYATVTRPNMQYHTRYLERPYPQHLVPIEARPLFEDYVMHAKEHPFKLRYDSIMRTLSMRGSEFNDGWWNCLMLATFAEVCTVKTPTVLSNAMMLVNASIGIATEKVSVGYGSAARLLLLMNPVDAHFIGEDRNILHNEKGPAITYLRHDGFRKWELEGLLDIAPNYDAETQESRRNTWSRRQSGWDIIRPTLQVTEETWLNGVEVPGWAVYEDPQSWGMDILMRSTNADVQREVIRRMGEDRLMEVMGADCISKSADGMYHLMTMKRPDGHPSNHEKWLFLKMENPSMPGVVHVEPVAPECETVEQAINYRGTGRINNPWKPVQLT